MALEHLQGKIREHYESGVPLRIVGSDSKSFFGMPLTDLETISSDGLETIVHYEPSELVLQVEAGCRLKVIKEQLAQHGQMLAFDPPDFGESTIGGAIAAGIDGSRRPYSGAGRDFLLGANIIDGTGERFSFGGQVMKNVAGYDVARLMSGSMGCLGLITELSLKVLPRPLSESSWVKPVDREQLAIVFKSLKTQPEVSASAWVDGQFYLRFSGTPDNVSGLAKQFGGEPVDNEYWSKLDSMRHFSSELDVWRVSTTPTQSFTGSEVLVDWGGAQRWYTGEEKPTCDGFVSLVKSADANRPRFDVLTKPVSELHQRLKQKFDPKQILNPNKMYQGL